MAVYTVLEPPLRDARTRLQPEQFVFVRDGFHGWAFLLTPVWMLCRRLWVVFVLYLVLAAALAVGLWAIAAPSTVIFLVAFLLSLLAGLEASTLRRWTLQRHGWTTVGVVVEDDPDTAERRFFDFWGERSERPVGSPAANAPDYHPPADTHSAVTGLFPEPGGQR